MLGGSTAPEKHCRISTYVKYAAPLFYDNLQDLCLFGLIGTRGGSGVTLLLPDKKTQTKIDKLVGKDAAKATSMIQACVLPVHVQSLSDFKKGLPNKLGHKLSVKSVTASSVELKSGAKIKVDPKFKRLHDASNIAVFALTGEIPVTGEEFKKVTGGDDQAIVEYKKTSNYDWHVINEEADAVTKIRKGTCHLLHLGISLKNWLLNHEREEYKALGRVFCKLNPISLFYFKWMGPICGSTILKEWCQTPHLHSSGNGYKNLDALKEQLAIGAEFQSWAQIESTIKHKDKLCGLTALRVCEQVQQHTLTHVSSLAWDEHEKAVIAKYWGGMKELSLWHLSVGDWGWLYDRVFANAFANSDTHEMDYLFDAYNRWARDALVSKRFSAALLLFDHTTNTNIIISKERFCSTLSAFNSRKVLCHGTQDLEDLASKIAGDDPSGVKYVVGGFKPNTLKPTSSEPTVARVIVSTTENI